MSKTVRARVVIPRDLLAAIDSLAGGRGRSKFITEALREKVTRVRQGRALRDLAGVLDPADYPEWGTPEKVAVWVSALRAADDQRTEEKLRGSGAI